MSSRRGSQAPLDPGYRNGRGSNVVPLKRLDLEEPEHMIIAVWALFRAFPNHSVRKATIGSTAAARRAGR